MTSEWGSRTTEHVDLVLDRRPQTFSTKGPMLFKTSDLRYMTWMGSDTGPEFGLDNDGNSKKAYALSKKKTTFVHGICAGSVVNCSGKWTIMNFPLTPFRALRKSKVEHQNAQFGFLSERKYPTGLLLSGRLVDFPTGSDKASLTWP